MKRILLFLLMAAFTGECYTQNAGLLIKQADSLEAALNETAAYIKFKEALRIDPGNFYSLWKCSELCSRIGFRQPAKEKKADYYTAGRIYAETAIKVKPDAADGYYALSLAMGRRAQIESGNDRIWAVREIKLNAEKALKINPHHGRAWHVLGKWHYEVSNLNGVEKAALKIFYGGLPKASLKDAIAAYEKARTLEPVFALNNLELAKACYKDGQKEKAIALLKAIPAMPAKTEDDARIKTEGKMLLDKWTK
jgi:hypothetical protein